MFFQVWKQSHLKKVSVFSGSYQSESRRTDLIGSSLIASNHLSLSSDSRRASNRKHFGRNIDMPPGERERERETEDLWEKLIYFTLWKLSKAQFNLSQSLRRFLVYTDADLLFFLNHNSMHFTHGRNIYLYFFSLYFNWKLYFGCFVFADLLYCFHSNYIFPFLRKVWEDTAFAPWSYSYSLSLKSGVSWEKGCFGVSQIHLNLQSCSPWMHLKSF